MLALCNANLQIEQLVGQYAKTGQFQKNAVTEQNTLAVESKISSTYGS